MAESRTLATLAEETFARLGDHEALICGGESLRSAALRQRTHRVAGGLADLGIAAGDRVVVLMANCPEVLITYNAVWRAGAVVTPAVFLLTAAEVRHILVDSGAVAVVTTAELAGTVLDAVADAPAVRHVIVAGSDALPVTPAHGPRLVSFSDLENTEARPLVERSSGDLAALMYTGGTTGRAKGVPLTHGNLLACGAASWEVSHVPGVTRTLVPLPLSHAYGLIVTVVGMHADEPGVAIIQRWFNPGEWVELCQQHRAQRTTLVPAMVQMLLAEPLEDCDLSSLRHLGSGAAPLSVDVLHEFERRVPSVEITEGYGCTESSAVISSTRPGRRRVGSVGQPISVAEVRITGEHDRPLKAGEDGEICVRGPGVMKGYWHDEKESAQVLRGGWLHTGDIGHLDDDRYLYIVDRKKDIILRGGFNVYPRDVEDVLLAHPDVAMAGVVGRPDPRLGEEVVAFVSLRAGAGADADSLIAFARTRLAATKSPREVRVLQSIPLTSVGKLDRKALRDLLAAPTQSDR